MYYLQSRYYGPEVGRLVNADAYASTGQGILGCNMFAYCLNNPIRYIDSNGHVAEVATVWIDTMWWLTLVDGPLPYGDFIFSIGFVVCVFILVSSDAKDNDASPGEVTSKDPPTEADGYYAPQNGPSKGKTKSGKKSGWKDRNGNIWVPAPSGSKTAHGGGHWDVERADGKGYINVYPGGRKRPGKGKPPVFIIAFWLYKKNQGFNYENR